jgi:hypothetical protein
VESDDQTLYFKALGMQSFRRGTEKLSFEGAAEFFWTMFVQPIQ